MNNIEFIIPHYSDDLVVLDEIKKRGHISIDRE